MMVEMTPCITPRGLRLGSYLVQVFVWCPLVVWSLICLPVSPPTHGAEITLAWDDPNNPDQDVDHYIVYFWQPDWDFPGSVAAGRYLTHTLFDLNAGQDYEFAVTVTDADGRRESEYSNIVAATLPAASFSRSPANGVVPLPVTFTDLSTGTITSWLWDFGDGETSMEQSPVHTYTAPGAYTVRLTVSGSEGTDVFTVVDMITATDDTTSTTMHVTDLDGSSRGHGRTWTALVTITVQDAARVVTPGAEVYGTWSGAYAGSGRCTTDSNGQCTLASGDIRKNKSSTTFTVDGIAHGTLTYQPANNDDPDGDSDGVRITIVKP